jgi:hypothetical protein
MCGRYRRRLDKQRIAELFAASSDLEELYFGPEDDVAPGSMQPVIRIDSRGERKISLMRWGFKREDAKLLFNARAENVKDVSFWKKSFSLRFHVSRDPPRIPNSRYLSILRMDRSLSELAICAAPPDRAAGRRHGPSPGRAVAESASSEKCRA